MAGKNENKTSGLDQEKLLLLLNSLYSKGLDGIPVVSKPLEQFANDYIYKSTTRRGAARKLIDAQVIKCLTSGVVTGFGGIITLPITIPANVASVLYFEMRMAAALAYIGGYDTESDETRALVFACLSDVNVSHVLVKNNATAEKKFAYSIGKKIPEKTIVAINERVALRLLSKLGTKGAANVGKMIPLFGAGLGGVLDLAESRMIGDRAYRWFIENDFSDKRKRPSKKRRSYHGVIDTSYKTITR